MKKLILLILIFTPCVSHAQFLGGGLQYGQKTEAQFVATLAAPIMQAYPANFPAFYLTSGLEYVSGRNAMTGINIKPISVNFPLGWKNNHNDDSAMAFGLEVGYLFSFHNKNGIVLTPIFYVKRKFIYFKAGYDMNVTGNQQQLFVRLGVCI